MYIRLVFYHTFNEMEILWRLKIQEMFPQKFHICSLFLNVSSLRNNTATHEDRKDTRNVTRLATNNIYYWIEERESIRLRIAYCKINLHDGSK